MTSFSTCFTSGLHRFSRTRSHSISWTSIRMHGSLLIGFLTRPLRAYSSSLPWSLMKRFLRLFHNSIWLTSQHSIRSALASRWLLINTIQLNHTNYSQQSSDALAFRWLMSSQYGSTLSSPGLIARTTNFLSHPKSDLSYSSCQHPSNHSRTHRDRTASTWWMTSNVQSNVSSMIIKVIPESKTTSTWMIAWLRFNSLIRYLSEKSSPTPTTAQLLILCRPWVRLSVSDSSAQWILYPDWNFLIHVWRGPQ